MTTRDIGDISTHPGGRSGADWTGGTRDSVMALWALSGGLLLDVSGTNTIVADVAVAEGFSAYEDGLKCGFIAAASNTGAATINISGVGAKAIRDPDGDVLEAGALIAGRFTEIVFIAEEDHFRLVTSGGTTQVTVQGGIMLQRSEPSRLATAAGPATALTSIGTRSFQCLYPTSRVVIEGVAMRVTGSGADTDTGATIALFVDGVQVQSFTDFCRSSSQVSTPFYFSHLPGNTDAHTYEVRCSATIATTYPRGSNVIWCSELSPNA